MFGPSELATQADNLSRLIQNSKFKTMVWAFHTPLKHFGDRQPYAWFDFSSAAGAQVMCDYMVSRLGPSGSFARIRGIPDANTAMVMGAMSSVQTRNKDKSVFLTGWGGTGEELQAIRLGELNATPMRMSDDVGAATAEAIKLDLEGRAAEMPLVFLGRITVAHDRMSKAEIDALEKEAFRYSGVGAIRR